jgi:hypothetical protein
MEQSFVSEQSTMSTFDQLVEAANMDEPLDQKHQTEFDLLKSYVMTLQTCKKCGVCFQNRFRVYQGEFTLCHSCRRLNRLPVIVVNYKTIDQTFGNEPRVTKEQYVIPIKQLSLDMLKSLNALQDTIITSKKITEHDYTKRIIEYENPEGELFYTQFKQWFERFKKPFNASNYNASKIYRFIKIIQ